MKPFGERCMMFVCGKPEREADKAANRLKWNLFVWYLQFRGCMKESCRGRLAYRQAGGDSRPFF